MTQSWMLPEEPAGSRSVSSSCPAAPSLWFTRLLCPGAFKHDAHPGSGSVLGFSVITVFNIRAKNAELKRKQAGKETLEET